MYWDRDKIMVNTLMAAGTSAMNKTLDNAVAAVDAGSGLVTIPCTGHGFKAGSMITLDGTDYYDDVMFPLSAVAANTFNVHAYEPSAGESMKAETFANTDTAKVILDPDCEFMIDEIRLHLSDTGADESFTVTVDSIHGSNYDCVIYDENTNGITDIPLKPSRGLHFERGDRVIFGLANTNTRTWGLIVKYYTKP